MSRIKTCIVSLLTLATAPWLMATGCLGEDMPKPAWDASTGDMDCPLDEDEDRFDDYTITPVESYRNYQADGSVTVGYSCDFFWTASWGEERTYTGSSNSFTCTPHPRYEGYFTSCEEEA
ncbi:MAG: hypothetical protein GY913_33000 [Proteobacteria bacterium]|nr:hypothetical protein [Pseudomonadota bacterium]MCP4921743.1 hypothetical protein [Pseudomonadota bacterium]